MLHFGGQKYDFEQVMSYDVVFFQIFLFSVFTLRVQTPYVFLR